MQQGSQIQYIYIKVSSSVDSSGWSFDSKLKKKIKNANKNRRNNRKTGTGLIFLFFLAVSYLLTCSWPFKRSFIEFQ